MIRVFTTSGTGLVLPGAWQEPPQIDGVSLPVIARAAFSRYDVRPGMQLVDQDLSDALAVVESMEWQLSREARQELGPVVIDALRAAETSLEVLGIVIDQEYERRIVFGRSPDAGEPGELPVDRKWASVTRGLDALRGGLDWRLLDVRWDRPDVHQRGSANADLESR